MIMPVRLFLASLTAMVLGYAGLGHEEVYAISYGAFALIAASISVTFFWLWLKRATPLALGMSFGWAGAASVMGWWWGFRLAGKPVGMAESPVLMVFLAIYFVGAILHFQVIGRSFGWRPNATWVPVSLAVLISVMVPLFV